MEEALIGFSVLVGIYVVYRLLRKPKNPEFDKMYNDIINSEEYKVKGQYDE
ncbi:hypothetical protein ACFLZX_02090 [Nanoarchaeota archaeon]